MGIFVDLEGLDGSGKTTQTELICKRLEADGINFRQIKLPLKSGFDIVFVARTKTVFKKSTEIYDIMLPMMQQAGVFVNEEPSS